MSNSRAVVLAGGKGERMNSSTPKILHGICGRPMFGWVVDSVFLSGIQDIAVVISSEIDSLTITESAPHPIKLVKQNQPLGTGHAIIHAAKHIEGSEGDILIINGDAPLIKTETLTSFMKYHQETDAVLTIMTCNGFPNQEMGSIVRDLTKNQVVSIIESRDMNNVDGQYTESNVGAYCIKLSWLLNNVNNIPETRDGQFYITSLVDIACSQGIPVKSYRILDESEASGVNNGVEMSRARNILQNRINDYWLMHGVNLIGPTYIDIGASIGADCTVFPNTYIYGNTRIGDNTSIGPNSIIKDTSIGSRCNVTQSVVENAIIEDNVRVGPFSHIRSDSHIDSGVSIGNYAEIKNTYIGEKTLVGHFSYLGDAQIGSNVNIGAGSITSNFDGISKHKTIIENNVFIGSDSMLIAPVRIGAGASTGAGSVVTKDVPSGAKVVGMPARIIDNKSPNDRKNTIP